MLGHFRFVLNPILLPPSLTFLPMCARSLALLSRPSSATMAMSLITPRPAHSFSHRVPSFACCAHTPLSKTVKPSALFVPLIILCALFFFRLVFHRSIGLTPYLLPPISLTVIPLRPSAASHHFLLSTVLILPTLIFEFSDVPVIPTCPPPLHTNYHLVPPCVCSLVTLSITRVIDVLTSIPTGSSSPVMWFLMSPCSPFLRCRPHPRIPPRWIF